MNAAAAGRPQGTSTTTASYPTSYDYPGSVFDNDYKHLFLLLGVIAVILVAVLYCMWQVVLFLGTALLGGDSSGTVTVLLLVLILAVLLYQLCTSLDDDDMFSGLDLGSAGTTGSWSWTPTNTPGTPREPGATGLHNLGNTCYMNSTLQCLSQVPELTALFVSDEYAEHLNRENPLGTKGVITDAYASLLKELWSCKFSSVAPVAFRTALTQRATQFSGYLQHDSQELLACLLDYLHEDMNQGRRLTTSKSQPCLQDDEASTGATESKAPDDMPDAPEPSSRKQSVSGTRAWERHVGLNDSVVSNTFQGQLRDRTVCPECGHESHNFDLVQYLTVPLPPVYTTVSVRVVPWLDPVMCGEAAAPEPQTAACVTYAVRVPSTGCVGDLCVELRRMANIPMADAMVAAEVSGSRVARMLHNTDRIQYMLPNTLVVYMGPPADYAPDAASKPLVSIPIHHRRTMWELSGKHYHRRLELFGLPYIMLTLHPPSKQEVYDVSRRWLELCYDQTAVVATSSAMQPLNSFGSLDDPVEPSLKVVDMFCTSCATCPYGTCKGCPLPEDDASWMRLCTDVRISVDWFTADDADGKFETEFDQIRTRVRESVPATEKAVWPTRFYHINVHTLVPEPVVLQGAMLEGPLWRLPRSSRDLDRAMQPMPPAQDDDGLSLERCLDKFQAEEVLGEDNWWLCPPCGRKVAGRKSMELWRPPPVLIIILKRFSQSLFQEAVVKNDALVRFPVNGLDLRPWVHGPMKDKGSLLYDCFAVSNHSGSMSAGHYTAYTKSCVSGEWSLFNDASVTPVGNAAQLAHDKAVERLLQTSAAYVLMYRRRDHVPVSSMQLLLSHLPPPPSPSPSLASTAITARSSDEAVDGHDDVGVGAGVGAGAGALGAGASSAGALGAGASSAGASGAGGGASGAGAGAGVGASSAGASSAGASSAGGASGAGAGATGAGASGAGAGAGVGASSAGASSAGASSASAGAGASSAGAGAGAADASDAGGASSTGAGASGADADAGASDAAGDKSGSAAAETPAPGNGAGADAGNCGAAADACDDEAADGDVVDSEVPPASTAEPPVRRRRKPRRREK